jgi:nucleotide-binding universal stress UspA family protein
MEGGTTVREIVAEVATTGADALVLGTAGDSHWHDLLVGGVTHGVVQLTHCPVLVVRGLPGPGSLRRLVVGADGSPGAARAADLTAALAAGLGASVLVVHVTEGSLADDEPDAVLAAAARVIGPERIAATPIRAIGEGGVAGALRSEAEAFGAGMLIVGRRGRSPLQRLVLGGVSERLLHIAPCPLLVVPAAAAPEPLPAGRAGQTTIDRWDLRLSDFSARERTMSSRWYVMTEAIRGPRVRSSRPAGGGAWFIWMAGMWVAFFWLLLADRLDDVWTWVTQLPILVEIIVWIVFFPWMLGTWVWNSSWPDWLRVALVVSFAVCWTIVAGMA